MPVPVSWTTIRNYHNAIIPTIRDGVVPSASSMPNSCVRSNVDMSAVLATF